MEARVQNVELVKVSARAYDFIGRNGEQVKGTSHKATLISPEGDIFVIKTDEGVYKDCSDAKGESGEAVIKITINEIDGKVNLFLSEFNWK